MKVKPEGFKEASSEKEVRSGVTGKPETEVLEELVENLERVKRENETYRQIFEDFDFEKKTTLGQFVNGVIGDVGLTRPLSLKPAKVNRSFGMSVWSEVEKVLGEMGWERIDEFPEREARYVHTAALTSLEPRVTFTSRERGGTEFSTIGRATMRGFGRRDVPVVALKSEPETGKTTGVMYVPPGAKENWGRLKKWSDEEWASEFARRERYR